LIGRRELAEAEMLLARVSLAVIAGDIGDELQIGPFGVVARAAARLARSTASRKARLCPTN